MKYILEYKKYINIDELLENLDFMSIDINDTYKVSIKSEKWTEDSIIEIIIEKEDRSYFKFDQEVRSYILRVNQYLGEMGFKCDKTYHSESRTNKNYNLETKFIIRPDGQFVNFDVVWLNDSAGNITNKIKLKFKLK